jgi:hypothetical protein
LEQEGEEEEEQEEDDACACRASAPPPETVAIAALKIAAGFLEDRRVDARWWAGYVAAAADVRVDARDVDLAVRCILVDVDYDLCAFSAEEVEKRGAWMMRGVVEQEAEEWVVV